MFMLNLRGLAPSELRANPHAIDYHPDCPDSRGRQWRLLHGPGYGYYGGGAIDLILIIVLPSSCLAGAHRGSESI